MVRKARIDYPGAFQHIMGRGIGKKDIFLEREDSEYFLKSLSFILGLKEIGYSGYCYAWSVLPNHFHLFMRIGKISLGTIMRRLLTGYAVYFNKKYNNSGHVFQNRYKSIVCNEEEYFLEVIRYIHLNPLRAGLVKNEKDLIKYPYSGHGVILGKQKRDWQQIEDVLKKFGGTRKEQIKKYREFMKEGLTKEKEVKKDLFEVLKEKNKSNISYDERILGSSDFVEKIREYKKDSYEKLMQRISLEELLVQVCKKNKVEILEIRGKSKIKKVVQARREYCYRAVKEYSYTGLAVSEILEIDGSTVSKAVKNYVKKI